MHANALGPRLCQTCRGGYEQRLPSARLRQADREAAEQSESEECMRREQILTALHTHRAELERFGVTSLALFGSAARDELGTQSDVDVLVEFGAPVSFDRYMDTKLYLEDLLERPVDLVTRRALRPQLRPAIERELLYVA